MQSRLKRLKKLLCIFQVHESLLGANFCLLGANFFALECGDTATVNHDKFDLQPHLVLWLL